MDLRFIALAGGAGVLALTMRLLSPQVRAVLGIVLLTSAGAVWAFEGFLTWQAYQPPDRSGTPGFDTRSVLEVVRDLQADGVEAVPALLPAYVAKSGGIEDLLPLCGIRTATTVFCNESGTYVIYESDEHGFNNQPGLGDVADVIVLGDSFAHGQCAPSGKDVAGRLRAAGHRAVNLGCAGTGPLAHLAALVEYGLAFKPRTVLWLYFEGNDEGDLEEEMKNPRWTRYLDGEPYQHLRGRAAEVEAFWRRYLSRVPEPSQQQVTNPRTIAMSIAKLHHVRRLFGLDGASRIDALGPLESVLSRATELTSAADAKLVFVYLPSWQRLHARKFRDRRGPVLGLVRRLQIPIVDFTETVATHTDPDSLFPNRSIGHYNEAGHRLLAETIARCAFMATPTGGACH